MGVSGAGKSTIAQALAESLSAPFIEGDDYHPRENVEKMSSGQALENSDRESWIAALTQAVNETHHGRGQYCILACSALNVQIREWIDTGLNEPCRYIYLDGSYDLIAARLSKRTDHFFNPALLRSQFDTLDIPEHALKIDINVAQDVIVSNILNALDI